MTPTVEIKTPTVEINLDPSVGILYGDSKLPPQWKLIVAKLRSETGEDRWKM